MLAQVKDEETVVYPLSVCVEEIVSSVHGEPRAFLAVELTTVPMYEPEDYTSDEPYYHPFKWATDDLYDRVQNDGKLFLVVANNYVTRILLWFIASSPAVINSLCGQYTCWYSYRASMLRALFLLADREQKTSFPIQDEYTVKVALEEITAEEHPGLYDHRDGYINLGIYAPASSDDCVWKPNLPKYSQVYPFVFCEFWKPGLEFEGGEFIVDNLLVRAIIAMLASGPEVIAESCGSCDWSYYRAALVCILTDCFWD